MEFTTWSWLLFFIATMASVVTRVWRLKYTDSFVAVVIPILVFTLIMLVGDMMIGHRLFPERTSLADCSLGSLLAGWGIGLIIFFGSKPSLNIVKVLLVFFAIYFQAMYFSN